MTEENTTNAIPAVYNDDGTVLSLSSEDTRKKRNDLLTETDWWAVSDRTMTAEQTAYRQALRDITDQVGFPHDINWPTKPE